MCEHGRAASPRASGEKKGPMALRLLLVEDHAAFRGALGSCSTSGRE